MRTKAARRVPTVIASAAASPPNEFAEPAYEPAWEDVDAHQQVGRSSRRARTHRTRVRRHGRPYICLPRFQLPEGPRAGALEIFRVPPLPSR